jgi:hypothetical protein
MKTSIKVFHWLPRIICIVAILYISLFAFDVFKPGLSLWQQLGALFIHLIPSFVLFHSIWNSLLVILTVTFPFVVVGVLFIMSYKKKKKNAIKV